jgi:hypothetical protein
MGRRRDGNQSPKKKKIQYRIQWEMKKNGYPIPDPQKAVANITKEPSDALKNSLKVEILQEIMEIHGKDAKHV